MEGEALDFKGKKALRNKISALESRVRNKCKSSLQDEEHQGVSERIDQFLSTMQEFISKEAMG